MSDSRWTPQTHAAEPRIGGETIDLLDYWRSIVKRKNAIVGFALSVALVAAAIVMALTPIYRATTAVLIESGRANVVAIDDVYSGVSQSREHVQTQLEIIKSRQVSLRTITALKLWDSPEFDPRKAQTGVMHSIRSTLGMVEERTPESWTEAELAQAVLPAFEDRRSIELVRLSQLVKVHFESADAALAARVANALAQQYIESDLSARYDMTRQASNWLQERLADLKTKLTDSERKLQVYRDSAGIIDTKGIAQSGVGQQLADINQRLIEARIRLAETETAYRQIRQAPAGADFSDIPAVLRNPSVSEAKRAQGDSERKFSEVSQRYGFEHPRYLAAKSELDASTTNLKRQVDSVVASLTREYEVAQGTIRALESTLGQTRSNVQNLNRKEFELAVLEREVQSNRDMLSLFINRAKETSAASDLQSTIARIVDPASPPEHAIKPKKTQVVLIALVLALMVGALLALLIEQLDRTLKTTDDVERKLGAPLLTTLPLLNATDATRAHSSHLFTDQPNSVFSEAIRSARSGVLLSSIDAPQRVILVTSTLPGEGKSTFAVNLAMAHAKTQRTLLIDADMRRPSLAKAFDLPPAGKGLSNLVAGTATEADCLLTMEGSELLVMTAGTLPPNPLELLSSQRFAQTLEQLKARFDVIIIDSPPVELVSDALMISVHTTGVIYVTKAFDTPTPLIKKGLERLRRANGPLLGVVLNQFDFAQAHKYHGDQSGYGQYGYGETGYGQSYVRPS
jgi:succinoglycan biosynthesis transport protein ExoP